MQVNQTLLLGWSLFLTTEQNNNIVKRLKLGKQILQDIPGIIIYHRFAKKYHAPLSEWNLAWDHVCNIVVIVPLYSSEEVRIARLEFILFTCF